MTHFSGVMKTCIRGIYEWNSDEDVPAWINALSAFPFRVPCFSSRREAIAWIRRFCITGSNPDRPHFKHIFTLVTTWDQVDRYILKRLCRYPSSSPARPPLDYRRYGEVESRLSLPLYRNRISRKSMLNTLRYLFVHQRCGIFVKIHRRSVCMFVPFANEDFQNSWSHCISFDSSDGSMDAYYKEKQSTYRPENILPNKARWWNNGWVIDNEMARLGHSQGTSPVWMDFFLAPLREMLEAACELRDMPDCEFFINKRDHPQLLKDPTLDPTPFINDKKLPRCSYTDHVPIMSFYTGERYADIPWPTTEDWEIATSRVYPATFWHYVRRDGELVLSAEPRDTYQSCPSVPWGDRVAVAFFRGTCTGSGTQIDTNQRLHLAHLSHVWQRPDLLDAALTGWNLRDKMTQHGLMTYIKKQVFPFYVGRDNFVPFSEQARYKYLIYVQGHSAASRLTYLLRIGACILKIESSCEAPDLWYSSLLREWEHYIPVKADLSDLKEKIIWCKAHDELCRAVSRNAVAFYSRYLCQDAILDYIYGVACSISHTP